MRDNIWLEQRLRAVWKRYFPDLKQINQVMVGFGRRAKTRLGSIRLDKKSQTSVITVSGFLRNEDIPVFVIDAVLAHELVHYLHGFASPHPKLLKHPHQGGAVDKEMIGRGMEDLLRLQKSWVKKYHKTYFK